MTQAKTPLRTEALIDILGCIVLFAFVVAQTSLLRDPGIGWHLRTGEWILMHRAVPHVDPFLFTTAGKIWICNQWLADTILWLFYSIGGGAALQAVVFLICVIPYVALAPRWARRHDCSAPAVCIGILIAMGLGAVQWYARPVIFSFLFFALTYKLLLDIVDQQKIKRAFIVLPLLFLSWANFHPGFPLGLVAIICCLMDQIFKSGIASRSSFRIVSLLLVCFAATLVNPVGFELYRSAYGLIANDYFMNLNIEWLSPNFHNPVFYPFILAIALCCAAPVNRPVLSLFERLVFALFICMALRGARYAPFLGIAAVTPLITSIQGCFARVGTLKFSRALTAFTAPSVRTAAPVGAVSGIFGLLILAYAIIFHSLPGWTSESVNVQQKFPQAVVDMLAKAPSGSKIFHTPDWGGFITFALWPRQRALIDDRNELNGQDAYEDFMTMQKIKTGWLPLIQQNDFRFMLVEKEAPLYSALKLLPDWNISYENDAMAVFEHTLPAVW